MTEQVLVFGFGSYFAGNSSPNDIDLVLIHADCNRKSCDSAIRCKAALRKRLPESHITILSQIEEARLAFLEQCNGLYIGSISSDENEIFSAVGDLIGSSGISDLPANSPSGFKTAERGSGTSALLGNGGIDLT